MVLTIVEGFGAVKAGPGRKGYMTNGITNKIRAARRRNLRATERILNSHVPEAAFECLIGHCRPPAV